MAVIDVNGVSYAHPGGSELFHDVSFRVANGRHAALIGPNGAGKTTLLQLIAVPASLSSARPRVDLGRRVQLMPQAIGTGPAAAPSASCSAGSGPPVRPRPRRR
jgi:ATPase subunit of ABC transporter with duplicated ATPase domains